MPFSRNRSHTQLVASPLLVGRLCLRGAVALLVSAPLFPQPLAPVRPARKSESSPLKVIRADVRMVLVSAIVADRKGVSVNGLTQDKFTILEDTAPQPILTFSREEAPCSVGVILDLSGSMRDKLPAATAAVRAFLKTANPEDESFLMAVASRPESLLSFTDDAGTLRNSLRAARAEGSTALIDTVYLGLSRMRSARNPRRALLIVSDGMDNNSRYSKAELLRTVQERDVQIYTIGIAERPAGKKAIQLTEESRGLALLGELAGQGFVRVRIDDVVQLIRGTKDSTVRLDILPADAGPDAKHAVLALVRKKISMEEQSAKKSIIEVRDNGVKRRIGVISLPTFYQDFDARRRGDKDFKSATRDVSRLLGELKKDKVDNVLIDLRNNGGGSLNEAVDLTGLFIDKGPVVMQRNAEGKVDTESDTNAGLAWDGPMGVLINRGSASASEIFAAAIQAYGRGLVIGEGSFGKGTVQTLIDLNRFGGSDKARFGELKMTVAQFFRINGGTTQLRGVTPDIKLPAMSDTENFGESSYDNALPWVSIKPANYTPTGDLKDIVPLLDKKHEARVAKDKDFQYLQDDIALIVKQRKDNQLSLNEAVRRKERDAQDARAKAREKRLIAQISNPGDDLVVIPDPKDVKSAAGKTAKQQIAAVKGALRTDDGLQGDERALSTELDAETAAKSAKDVLLNETARILADEVSLIKADTRLAAKVLPYATDAKGAPATATTAK